VEALREVSGQTFFVKYAAVQAMEWLEGISWKEIFSTYI
jgi:hypothetical protein